jgi:hypothetical protein
VDPGRRIQDTEEKTDALEKYFAEELPALIAHCILKVHAKGKTTAQGIDLGPIARQTPSKSGADLAYLMNEGASIAEHSNKSEMDQDDFANALERIPVGMEKTDAVRTEKTDKYYIYYYVYYNYYYHDRKQLRRAWMEAGCLAAWPARPGARQAPPEPAPTSRPTSAWLAADRRRRPSPDRGLRTPTPACSPPRGLRRPTAPCRLPRGLKSPTAPCRPPCDDGLHRHVLPGRPHRLRLG